MPFGLCNAVPAFERLMENVLVDLKWRMCLVYLDDCVIFSEDFPTHLVRIRQVLEHFRKAGFKLKMKKRHWVRDQVAFLGYIVTPTGILPNPEKVKALMNVQKPHDLHTLRAFLGLTSYFRRYIPGFAAIAAPLERLKQKDVAFHWDGDSTETGLSRLYKKIQVVRRLIPFSRGSVSDVEVDGRDRAVAYASKMLTGSQRNWIDKTSGTTEIECWGIATRKFRCYLDHNKFDLYTDHQALTENARTTNAKLVRWAMELSQLRFKIHHKPGTSMGHADGLSRLNRLPTVSVIRTRSATNAKHISGTTDEENVENHEALTVDEPEGIKHLNVAMTSRNAPNH
ncbi:LOW QUALITY PROTEIN: Retrovirus-related Pol Polyprotein from transposon 412 [Phytophthora megakarya]|uniref:Retrovirus-related Pol Polyprotein from transposon 412 n=1 Tax=Phytophthora megakarya TaxID=4795 RepID=A0A225USG7_9STRA|nr:LOW QUALITY PROTEIN: Retrovirus-related Pol Polyprotein from transposon 412 [Phytophthora megakarya]